MSVRCRIADSNGIERLNGRVKPTMMMSLSLWESDVSWFVFTIVLKLVPRLQHGNEIDMSNLPFGPAFTSRFLLIAHTITCDDL